MREIKFKIWDKEYRYMGTPVSLQTMLHDVNEKIKISNISSLVFLEFTGLKDKNGVEIYEGDILKNINDFGTHYNQVIFHEGMFTCSSDDYKMPLNMSNSYQEVTGNIHENPELLKENKDGGNAMV